MIILKIDSTKATEYANLILTTKGHYISIEKKMDDWIAGNLFHVDLDIIQYIKTNIRKLLTSEPVDLEAHIADFTSKGYQSRIYDDVNEELKDIGKVIKKIFNYDAFRKSARARAFAKKSKIKSCTTCNTQYMLVTRQKKGEKLLFHLDHYFTKSVYPYLSLSYYNLIPSCANCNMSKSDKPYTLATYLHPYVDSFHQIAKFCIDKKSLAEFALDTSKNEDKLSFSIEIRRKYIGDHIYETKLKNYLNEFRIEEQYMQFKDIIADVYLNSLFYNSSRRSELIDFFSTSPVKVNNDLIDRFILGNYSDDKDLLKRPLAKFMRDIGEDMGIV